MSKSQNSFNIDYIPIAKLLLQPLLNPLKGTHRLPRAWRIQHHDSDVAALKHSPELTPNLQVRLLRFFLGVLGLGFSV